jgi:hypothetical protein
MVRFYTLHGLAFFLGAIGLYYLVTRRPTWGATAATGLAVMVAFWFAYHLQYTTVIGGIALALWLVIEISPRVFRYMRDHRSLAIALIFPALIAGSGSPDFFFLQTDTAARYWSFFRGVPSWAEPSRDDLAIYVRGLERTYPLLWTLFPVAAIIAIARYGRPAVFSIVLFAVPLILHSLAASRHTVF